MTNEEIFRKIDHKTLKRAKNRIVREGGESHGPINEGGGGKRSFETDN